MRVDVFQSSGSSRKAGVACAIALTLGILSGCRGHGGDADRDAEFGMRSARAGLWNEALYRWERAAAARPSDPKLHNNLGVAYEHEGRYDDARREYKKALDLVPDDEHVRRNYEAFENFYAGLHGKPAGSPDVDKPAPPPASTTSPETPAPSIEEEHHDAQS